MSGPAHRPVSGASSGGSRHMATRPTLRRPGRRRRGPALALVVVVAATALLAGACVEQVVIVQGSGPDGSAPSNLAVVGGQDVGDESVVARYAGREMSFGTVP